MMLPNLVHEVTKRILAVRTEVLRLLFESKRLARYMWGRGFYVYRLGDDANSEVAPIYIGSNTFLADLAHILNLQTSDIHCLAPLSRRNAKTQIQRYGERAQLIIKERLALGKPVAHEQDDSVYRFQIPAFIDPALDLRDDFAEQAAAIRSSRLRQKLRRAQREPWSIEMASTDEDFAFFYHHLWMPMIKAQHPGWPHTESFDDFLAMRQQLVLFFLKNDSTRLAGGVLIVPRSKTKEIRFAWVGFSEEILSDPQMMNIVNVAVYFEAFRIAHSLGFRRVLMGPTQPSLAKGSLWYKMCWGSDISEWKSIGGCSFDFTFKSKDYLSDFIQKIPFVHRQTNTFVPCVPWPQEMALTKDSVKSIANKYWFSGMKALDILAIGQIHDSMQEIDFVATHGTNTAINWLQTSRPPLKPASARQPEQGA